MYISNIVVFYSDILDVPLPTYPRPDDDEDEVDRNGDSNSQISNVKESVSPVRNSVSVSPTRNTFSIPNTERLIGGGGNGNNGTNGTSKTMTMETRYEDRREAENIPPLPEALEQEIEISKDADTLGVKVEEAGVNGMVVRSVTRGGTLARDGRIQPGDYLVAVNNENMRSLSPSQALAVLRRAQTVPLGGEIPITYIPASDAVVFRTSMCTRMECEETELRRSLLAEETPLTPGVKIEPKTIVDTETANDKADNVESALVEQWRKVLGPEFDILVAQISNDGGSLGIKMEEIVEEVDGVDQPSQYFIKTIHPNGPVGLNGKLKEGDELLEVNGMDIRGMISSDIASLYYDLPGNVRLVCSR